ncbi:MAG: helix-turn-helix transcriptional regulator [Polyangiales bacterium]
MATTKEHAVQLVDAAYDLGPSSRQWLRGLVDNGGCLLDYGLGCVAVIRDEVIRSEEHGSALVYEQSGDGGWGACVAKISNEGRPDAADPSCRLGAATLLDRPVRNDVLACIAQRLQCADVLEIWACNGDAYGVAIYVPSATPIRLTPGDRRRWRLLAAHIEVGHRLRVGIGLAGPGVCPETEMPERIRSVRAAAAETDRETPPHSAPNLAAIARQAVLDGKWSMVDWFDRDGRRLVLVRPNGPRACDPRALSPREYAIASYVAQGESGKVVASHLGISRALVSSALQSAMRKLGVRTHAQLVMQMRCLGEQLTAS